MDGFRDKGHRKGFHGKGQGKSKKSRPSAPGGGKKTSFPWINAQIISASESGDIHYLMSTIMSHLPHMNLVNLSTALHRLAKLAATDSHLQATLCNHDALQTLLDAICLSFSGLDPSEVQPQSISNVVWSLATMRYIDKHLLQALTHLTVNNIDQFKPFELSTTLWALAKLGSVDNITAQTKPVFQAAAQHITPLVSQFGFRCLATTAWAFATSKQRHARLFRAMAAQMLPMAQSANCQEMANTAWAFGTADFHDDQLFFELAEKGVYMLAEFKPQELSNMLWGFASNGFFHEEFFAAAAAVAKQMDLQAQHLANILWAFARVRPRHSLTRNTIQSLIPCCTQLLRTFKPQEVSSTALAVGKAMGLRTEDGEDLGSHDISSMPREVVTFFNACLDWVAPRLREFSVQSLANTVSAYTMVPVPGSRALFDAVGIEVLRRFEDLEMASMLHLLKAFAATPRGCGGRVVGRLATSVAKHLSALKPQELQTVMRVCHQFEASTAGPGGGPRAAHDLSLHEMHRLLMGLATADCEADISNVPHIPFGYHQSHASGQHRLRNGAHPHPAAEIRAQHDFWEDDVHSESTGSWGPARIRAQDDLWEDDVYSASTGSWGPASWMHTQQQLQLPPRGLGQEMRAGGSGGSRQIKNRPRKRGEASAASRVNQPSLQDLVSSQPGLCTISEASMPYSTSAASAHMSALDPAIMAISDDSRVLDPAIVGISGPPRMDALMMQAVQGGMTPYQTPQADALGQLVAGAIPGMGHHRHGHGPPAYPQDGLELDWAREDNPFLAYQMARRGKFDRNAEHRWSVKNSFLHLESSDSDREQGDDDNKDGSSSQRSSSAPSTMSRAEYRQIHYGEGPRRHPVQEAMAAQQAAQAAAFAAMPALMPPSMVMAPHEPASSTMQTACAAASHPSAAWPCGGLHAYAERCGFIA